MITGSCLCGGIRLRITGPLGPVTYCHCMQCRKSTGHVAPGVPVRWSDIEMDGTPTWYDSTPGKARRGFCGTCGSTLVWEEFDGLAYLMAGLLDAPTGLKADGHIFYADKGDYYRASDGLPCFAAGRSGPQVDP